MRGAWILGILCLLLAGCGSQPAAPTTDQTPTDQTPALRAEPQPQEESAMTTCTLTVDGRSYTVTLADTQAAQALARRLPLTLQARELNGNEKYANLDRPLPASPTQPDRIHTGDLMLYGDDCLVLFYKDFTTPYRYTPVGTLQNPEDLAQVVGGGSVTLHLA